MNYLTGYSYRTHFACTLQTSACLDVKNIKETKPERIIISDESTFSGGGLFLRNSESENVLIPAY